jgi:glycosyltransferase involved in cell wall biosynthesis
MNPACAVSVIIPCFKQAHYLRHAIESVLAQDCGEVVEIIVVVDGSPDDTAGVAASFGDRVRYIRKANAGLSAARNTGILAARGTFLIYLDADDYLPSDLIRRHIAAAAARSDADVFYSTYHFVDEEGKAHGPRFDPVLPEEAFHTFLEGTYFPPHAAMTRRSALANCGLFDVNLRSLEDWDMWIRLAAAGSKFVRTADVSVPYRQYPNSMSTNRERMRRCGLQVLKKAAQYHGRGCRQCRRSLAAGRWGVRTAFLTHTSCQVREAHWAAGAVLGGLARVARAALHDPLLPVTPVRQWARRAKWALRRRASPAAAL